METVTRRQRADSPQQNLLQFGLKQNQLPIDLGLKSQRTENRVGSAGGWRRKKRRKKRKVVYLLLLVDRRRGEENDIGCKQNNNEN